MVVGTALVVMVVVVVVMSGKTGQMDFLDLYIKMSDRGIWIPCIQNAAK